MSLIEFQVSSSAFLAAQRKALRSLQLCPPSPMAIGPVQIIIDKIEFGNNAIRHDEPARFPVFYDDGGILKGDYADGNQTQIAQDATIYVTTLNDILSSPNQPPSITVALQVTLVFNMDFFRHDEDCFITVEFIDVKPGPLPFLPPNFDPRHIPLPISIDQLFDGVKKAVKALIPTRTSPAGLSKLTSVWAKFLNAGVSVDGQLQRIAFRAQIGGSSTYVAVKGGMWSNFFNGFFDDRLGGSDWAFFIDKGLITEKVKVEVNQGMVEADIDHLETFVGCNYSNAGGKAVFTLDVMGIYDLPDPLPTISRHTKIPMELSVSEPNTLKLRADYSDVIRLIHSFNVIEFFLPSLSNAIEGFVQVQIGSALADLNKDEGAPYCKKISSAVVECKKTVQMPKTNSGGFSILTNLLALDDGISLVGTMKSSVLTPTVLSTMVREFKWQPPKISCSKASIVLVAAFKQSPSDFAVLHAEAVVDNQGTTPMYLCDWSIINDDSLGAFPASRISVDSGPAGIKFSLNMPIPGEDYYQDGNRYPCDLLVKTTAGTRLLRIQPPPKITQADIDKLAAELLAKIGDCEQLVAPWFEHYHGYNPVFSVDPPFDAHVDHLWQVEITGLPSGETAALFNSSNKELMRATAKSGTTLRLSALLEPQEINELTVMRGGGQPAVTQIRGAKSLAQRRSKNKSNEKNRGIEVGQQLLVKLGSISLNDECQSMQLTTVLATRCVLAVLRNGIKAYDFSNPMIPTLIRSWDLPGVRGAITWQGALLFFGEAGFGWIDGQGERKSGVAECHANPILDATAAAHVLYAVTSKNLEIYSKQMCKEEAIAFDGGRCLALTAGKLVVGGRNGLFVYDTKDPLHTKCGLSLDGIDVRAVMRPLGTEAGTILASLEDGSARLLRVTGSELEETASFAQAPWFVGSVRLGDLLVRIGKDGRSLDVSRFGESQVI